MANKNTKAKAGIKTDSKVKSAPSTGTRLRSGLNSVLENALHVAILTLILGLIIGGSLAAAFMVPSAPANGAPACPADLITAEQVALKVQTYINENPFLPDGFEATGAETVEFNEGLYRVNFSISDGEINEAQSVMATADGKIMFMDAKNQLWFALDEAIPEQQPPEPPAPLEIEAKQPLNPKIHSFADSSQEICAVDGKPIVRMFASSNCGYCMWNKPIFEKVVREYIDAGKIVGRLWEDGLDVLSDSDETMSEEEIALSVKFNSGGGVPLFVMGCKYYRVGASNINAENAEAVEEAELRAVIEDLLSAQ